MSDEEMQMLKKISDDCKKRKECDGCKFDLTNGNGCILKFIPYEWKFPEPYTEGGDAE